VILFKEKIRVCHRPPGNPSNQKTLTTSYLSALDHVAHGDAVGSCESEAIGKNPVRSKRPGRR
jgi:hypothetical protein